MKLADNLKEFVSISQRFIEKDIRIIIEAGARDCQETLGFHALIPDARIFAFECNPMTLPLCRQAVQEIPNIHLTEKAVSNIAGKIKFYPINPQKTETTWPDGNPGASSLFKASGRYPVERYVQDEIEVEALTLKDFMDSQGLREVDLLWMDIQGAELMALEGLGNLISNVHAIHLEVEFLEIYQGQPLYKEVKSYLVRNGFLLFKFTNLSQYSGDAIFFNKRLVNDRLNRLKLFLSHFYLNLLHPKLMTQ